MAAERRKEKQRYRLRRELRERPRSWRRNAPLPAWEVPKRDPHERRPRAPDLEPEELAAEIAELAAERDDTVGADIAA